MPQGKSESESGMWFPSQLRQRCYLSWFLLSSEVRAPPRKGESHGGCKSGVFRCSPIWDSHASDAPNSVANRVTVSRTVSFWRDRSEGLPLPSWLLTTCVWNGVTLRTEAGVSPCLPLIFTKKWGKMVEDRVSGTAPVCASARSMVEFRSQ